MTERYYGGEGTIHHTGAVNVELDKKGRVVSVWFRCALLPFTQNIVEKDRVEEMKNAYQATKLPPLSAVVFKDEK